MPAYEVSRTLVKSPPEVWSELEQAERLAELLGDDAIKITRREPETKIEWQGAAASGTIEIGASGWGTKVRLTAEPVASESVASPVPEANPATAPAAEPAAAEPAAAEPDSAAESGIPKPDTFQATKPDPLAEPKTAAESGSAALPEPKTAAESGSAAPGSAALPAALDGVGEAEAASKVSFWRRIRNAFSTQPTEDACELVEQPADDCVDADADDPAEAALVEAGVAESIEAAPIEADVVESIEATPVETGVAVEPSEATLVDSDPSEDQPNAAQSAQEAPATADFESLLTSVLDHLGSAHRRPFSAV
ncbi:MAG: hypothetical protein HY827_04955 [Actinobacteria bacterium]|nr:hypothetical protein [Actinomycetota bacterium]